MKKLDNIKNILIKLIQESVEGCAENWAPQIADHLIKNGTYIYGKEPIDIINESRLTDPRFLNGWYEPESVEVMYASMPSMYELYSRLGTFENLLEDDMLMQFKPIDTESGDNTF